MERDVYQADVLIDMHANCRHSIYVSIPLALILILNPKVKAVFIIIRKQISFYNSSIAVVHISYKLFFINKTNV